jgi:NTE family protein
MGQAYHAGVLAALQIELGWDARELELVVGTSAGAVTGALLRLGTSPLDLLLGC